MKIELFVPGRLCLFGEHTDWAGKYRTMNADIVSAASIVIGIELGFMQKWGTRLFSRCTIARQNVRHGQLLFINCVSDYSRK